MLGRLQCLDIRKRTCTNRTENQDRDENTEQSSSDTEHPVEEQNDNPEEPPNDTENRENDAIQQNAEEEEKEEGNTKDTDDTPVWAEVVQGFRFNPDINDLESHGYYEVKSTHHLIERLLVPGFAFH